MMNVRIQKNLTHLQSVLLFKDSRVLRRDSAGDNFSQTKRFDDGNYQFPQERRTAILRLQYAVVDGNYCPWIFVRVGSNYRS
jgi:hypothetical protein